MIQQAVSRLIEEFGKEASKVGACEGALIGESEGVDDDETQVRRIGFHD